MNIRKILLACFIINVSTKVFAAGPLILEGPAGQTPVKYGQGGEVCLNMDIGLLGFVDMAQTQLRTNSQTDTIAQDAFNLWNNSINSTVLLQQFTDLPQDIDVSNYAPLLPTPTGTGTNSHNDGINPFIFDHDGSIIDDIFGVGQSSTVAGFAASIFLIGGAEFLEGYAVMSGSIALSDSDLRTLFAHELGHFIGLDHAQHPGLTTNCMPGNYPLMYPFLCRTQNSLHPDDESSIASLYPSSAVITNYGQLTGSFTTVPGVPIPGVNIWVEDTVSLTRYSVVSDYLKQGSGFFSVLLPPGVNYELHAEAIDTNFFGASSVGPYAETMSDISFSPPAGLPITLGGGTPTPITITAGNKTNVNFKLDGSGTPMPGGVMTVSVVTGTGICTTTPQPPPAGGGGGGYIRAETLLFVLLVLLLSARYRHLK